MIHLIILVIVFCLAFSIPPRIVGWLVSKAWTFCQRRRE